EPVRAPDEGAGDRRHLAGEARREHRRRGGDRHLLPEGVQPDHRPAGEEGVRHRFGGPEAPRPLRAPLARPGVPPRETARRAGRGIQPGRAVGQTNALGEVPTEAPYYTEDLAATVYHCLGVPLDTTHHTPDGRPVQVNYDGRLIRELL